MAGLNGLLMTTVELLALTKRYGEGEPTAVDNLTLTINESELLVLLGPSGCGKTTTLRLIAGLTTPTRGNICFDGVSMLAVPPERRGAVMVFQSHALFPFMTVADNVAFGLQAQKRYSQAEIRRRVQEVLHLVHLPHMAQRWPNQLSGGQQQRISLARALAVRPKILLLDEPLSHLEQPLREELRQMLRDLQQRLGITTLFVTHDQMEAVTIGDRIGVMVNGRIQQIASPRTLYEVPTSVEVARFLGHTNFLPGRKRGKWSLRPLAPLKFPPLPYLMVPSALPFAPKRFV